jgi:hypothetical protein
VSTRALSLFLTHTHTRAHTQTHSLALSSSPSQEGRKETEKPLSMTLPLVLVVLVRLFLLLIKRLKDDQKPCQGLRRPPITRLLYLYRKVRKVLVVLVVHKASARKKKIQRKGKEIHAQLAWEYPSTIDHRPSTRFERNRDTRRFRRVGSGPWLAAGR